MVKQKEETKYFLQHCGPYRVKHDSEGFPYLPGKYGNIEWHEPKLMAIYTKSSRKLQEFLAIEGVKPHQMGDKEARMLFPVSVLDSVARVAKTSRKYVPSASQQANLAKGTPFRASH